MGVKKGVGMKGFYRKEKGVPGLCMVERWNGQGGPALAWNSLGGTIHCFSEGSLRMPENSIAKIYEIHEEHIVLVGGYCFREREEKPIAGSLGELFYRSFEKNRH